MVILVGNLACLASRSLMVPVQTRRFLTVCTEVPRHSAASVVSGCKLWGSERGFGEPRPSHPLMVMIQTRRFLTVYTESPRSKPLEAPILGILSGML